MRALAIALLTIAALSYCTIHFLGPKLRAPTTRLSILLIAISLALFGAWFVLNSYFPPTTIGEHWRMAGISLLAFFAVLGPIAAAIRNAQELRSFVIAVTLIGVALAALLLAAVSIPTS